MSRLPLACHLPPADGRPPSGALLYARYVQQRLRESGRVVPAPDAAAEAILSLDGRFRAGRGQPTVTAVFDLGHLTARRAYPAPLWLRQNWRVASAARRSDRILVASTALRAGLAAHLGVKESRVIVLEPLPASALTRAPLAKVKRLRADLGLPERYFVFVGSRGKRKNLALLGRAWREVCSRLDDSVGLVLAGPERGGLPGLSRVLDIGYVGGENLPALLSGAIAYLNPSLYEGSGIGAQEAMACGTPAIVAPTGALPRAVDAAGIVLDAFDAAAWADALQALATRPALRAELSRTALRLTAERRAHPPDLVPLLGALGA